MRGLQLRLGGEVHRLGGQKAAGAQRPRPLAVDPQSWDEEWHSQERMQGCACIVPRLSCGGGSPQEAGAAQGP